MRKFLVFGSFFFLYDYYEGSGTGGLSNNVMLGVSVGTKGNKL